MLQPLSDCSFACAGNKTQYCGAGNRLDLYLNDTATENPPTDPPPTGPSFPGYTFQGCLLDSVASRILRSKSTWSAENTYASCAAFCAGYPFFGTEYASECYCGDTLRNSSSADVPLADCNMPCSGNSSQTCGAGNRITVFTADDGGSSGPSNPEVAGYAYKGCYVDDVGNRILGGKFWGDAGMTVEKCKGFCTETGNGTRYFGTEFSSECYCGEALVAENVVGQGECGHLCGGNTSEWCGGASRVSVYERI